MTVCCGGWCAGCTFADFDGYSIVYTWLDAHVSLVQCTFAGNTLFPHQNGAAVIEAADAGKSSPQVRLEGCTFSNNVPYTLSLIHI